MKKRDCSQPDWKNIETVLLDMDGTVLDLGFDTLFWQKIVPQRFADLNGITFAQARERLEPIYLETEGTLDWYCLDFWTHELGIDIEQLKNEVDHLIQYLPGAREFLEWLAQSGKRAVLVTNAHQDSLNVKIRRTGLDQHFHAMFSAHEFGMPKETPEFWARFSERERFDPQRTLLVDDSLPVLRAAREFGITQLFAVSHPDLTAPARKTGEFPAVYDLSHLRHTA